MINTQQTLPRVSPVVPPLPFLPVAVYLAVAARAASPGMVAFVILCAGGLLCWTFAEYLIHRFVFHAQPASQLGRRMLYLYHGFHHEFPTDLDRVVLSPLASVPLAAVFYLCFRVALGPHAVGPFFAGFLAGYVCYDAVHYAIHHRSLSRYWPVRPLKRLHFRHHFRDHDVDFGVTSPLWDRVFSTSSCAQTPPS